MLSKQSSTQKKTYCMIWFDLKLKNRQNYGEKSEKGLPIRGLGTDWEAYKGNLGGCRDRLYLHLGDMYYWFLKMCTFLSVNRISIEVFLSSVCETTSQLSLLLKWLTQLTQYYLLKNSLLSFLLPITFL